MLNSRKKFWVTIEVAVSDIWLSIGFTQTTNTDNQWVLEGWNSKVESVFKEEKKNKSEKIPYESF